MGRLLLGILLISIHTLAGASPGDFRINGFGSIAVGKVTDGNEFVNDFPNGGHYDKDLSFSPDTSLGVQGTVEINDKASATMQLMSRGVDGFQTDVEWAYLSYQLTPKLTAQAGRMRIPLFYYSDFYDVAYSYPWLRAPDNTYAWEMINYNGANLRFNDNFGDWAFLGTVYMGREDRNDIKIQENYYYNELTEDDVYGNASSNPVGSVTVNERWKDMTGIVLRFSRDWIELQGSYMEAKLDYDILPKHVPAGEDPATIYQPLVNARNAFSGFTANINWHNIVVKSDWNNVRRVKYDGYKARSWMAGIGYQMGNFLPMVTNSHWKDNVSSDNGNEDQREVSIVLRYDFAPSVTFKLQHDYFRDLGSSKLSDTSRLVTAGVDFVF